MDKPNKDFYAFISHKLLTPATVVKWNSEILSDRLKNEKDLVSMIGDISKSNQKQIDFVNVMLTVLKNSTDLESFKINLQKEFEL